MNLSAYQNERMAFWNTTAKKSKTNIFNTSYHQRISEVYINLIPQESKVLEIGSGNGDLLASLKPVVGVGIDFSSQQVQIAQNRHPELHFYCVDVDEISTTVPVQEYDFIILSDLLNDLWDVQDTFQRIAPYCHSRTRIIINFYSRLWQPILSLAQLIGLANPNLYQNWLTKEDVNNLLNLSGFESIKNWAEVLFPLPIPVLREFFNKFLVKIWPFHFLALSNFMVARPLPDAKKQDFTVSVIVPARNEAGNIENILKRTPEMGAGTEIVFVEGNSTDNTYQTIVEKLPNFPERRTCLLKQDGKGKGDAVRKGFSQATGDILMILDADLTVPPEDLPRFYSALVEGKGEFINGVRLVYPMEKEAMRFFNFLGNKFFSLSFSYLLSQSVKDTLCGTKVLFKADYEKIAANRSYFGDFDPFGDYDLIFGATKLNLKYLEIPIRYKARTYGTTNISRFKHGLLLIKMVFFAMGKIKFV